MPLTYSYYYKYAMLYTTGIWFTLCVIEQSGEKEFF